MAKHAKYFFDHQSLSLKKIRTTKGSLIRKGLFYVSFFIVAFVLAVFVLEHFYDSPKERKLRRDLSQSRIQYAQLEKRMQQLAGAVEDMQMRDQNLYRIIFEAEPPKTDPRYLGVRAFDEFKDNTNADIIVRTAQKIEALEKDLYALSLSFDDVYKMAQNKKELAQRMPAILPIKKGTGVLASGFGIRLHPVFREHRMHTGIDFAAPKGTPIYATGDGVIKSTGGEGYSGYGIVCVVDHGHGYQSLYAHCSALKVRIGQRVKRGELIAYVGSTGISLGTHLHYEVILNGKRVNPVYYLFSDLSPEEYEKILEKSNEINQSLS